MEIVTKIMSDGKRAHIRNTVRNAPAMMGPTSTGHGVNFLCVKNLSEPLKMIGWMTRDRRWPSMQDILI